MPEAKLLLAGYFDTNLHNFLNLKHYLPTEEYKIKVLNALKNSSKILLNY